MGHNRPIRPTQEAILPKLVLRCFLPSFDVILTFYIQSIDMTVMVGSGDRMAASDVGQCDGQSRPLSPLRQLEVEDSSDSDDSLDDILDDPDTSSSSKVSADCDNDSDCVVRSGREASPGVPQSVLKLKELGNRMFAARDYEEALARYREALESIDTTASSKGDDDCDGEGGDLDTIKATLHSNMSAALIQMKRLDDALQQAECARSLRPSWSKPYHRLAKIYIMRKDTSKALDICRAGENVVKRNYKGITEFSAIIGELTVKELLRGNDASMIFEGRRLEVRSAGADAWLGKPAPYVPELDGVLDEQSALASDDLSSISTQGLNIEKSIEKMSLEGGLHGGESARSDALVSWSYSKNELLAQERSSFRCIGEAVAAAKDGDRIVLLRGTHNGLGETVCIRKRILIEGDGSLGETVIDQRANVPTFKIERGGVVIRNLDIDHTGFREALLVDGDKDVQPLIEQCDIKCSGDDGVHVGGEARLVMRRCKVKAKKAGIKCFDASNVTVDRCIVEECGGIGLSIMDGSKLVAQRTAVRKCEEDGVVVMGKGNCTMMECLVSGNKGAGVDCSDEGYAMLGRCDINRNVGGCWSWDSSSILAQDCTFDGGASHVVLVDSEGSVDARNCRIQGGIHAPERAWTRDLLEGKNTFCDPEGSVDFPIESGPFQYVPSPYTSL
jgi:tetratricopeptide (TPR) repeat protein